MRSALNFKWRHFCRQKVTCLVSMNVPVDFPPCISPRHPQHCAFLFSICSLWKGNWTQRSASLIVFPLYLVMLAERLIRRVPCLCFSTDLSDKKNNMITGFTSAGRARSISEPSFPHAILGHQGLCTGLFRILTNVSKALCSWSGRV